MRDLLMNQPVMLFLTFATYMLGMWLNRKTGSRWLHPLFVCIPVLIAIILVFDIPCEFYTKSNDMVLFMLGPCVVAVGLKLYDYRRIIMEHHLSIISGVIVGSIVGVLTVMITGRIFHLTPDLVRTFSPKSVTTPIAMKVVESFGGNSTLIAVTVSLCGFVGNFLGPKVMDLCHIKNPISRGIGLGCASHGMGTARAIEEGALEGAVSGLCLGLMGVVTSVLVPTLVKFIIL